MKYAIAGGAVSCLLLFGVSASGCGEPQYDAPPPPPATEPPPPPPQTGMTPGENDPTPGNPGNP